MGSAQNKEKQCQLNHSTMTQENMDLKGILNVYKHIVKCLFVSSVHNLIKSHCFMTEL